MLQIRAFGSSKCTQLQTHTCPHTYTRTHTRTHPYTRMPLHAPERRRVCIIHIHVFGPSKLLRRYTHTHTHTRAHAHAGTHENVVEYACSKFIFPVQANARSSKHIHGRTHTCAHPYKRMLLHAPERRRVCVIHIHVFGSSKCLQKYTHTRTHSHAGIRTQPVRASIYVHTPEQRRVCNTQHKYTPTRTRCCRICTT